MYYKQLFTVKFYYMKIICDEHKIRKNPVTIICDEHKIRKNSMRKLYVMSIE
jgi:hypothetical protein